MSAAKDCYRSLFPDFSREGFHGDRIYQRFVDELIREVPISVFVETGTYLGSTTGQVASRHRRLDVRSCEVNPFLFLKARRRLWRLRNVSLTKASSEKFLADFLKKPPSGVPLFFLDAHGENNWPLTDELSTISSSGLSAVLLIDDFQVPECPQFDFDTWAGGSTVGVRALGVDLALAALHSGQNYGWLFPTYAERDAFGDNRRGSLRGHAVIFQNLLESFTRTAEGEFVRAHYRPAMLGGRIQEDSEVGPQGILNAGKG